MRFFVLQHGLKDYHSHCFSEALGWRRAFRRRNLEFELYIHRDAMPSIVTESGGIPVFPHEPTAEIERDPVSDDLNGNLFYGEAFGSACSVLDEKVTAEDVVIIPHTTARELYGVLIWLRTLQEHRRPRVVFIFFHPNFLWRLSDDGKQLTGDVSFFRHSANQLADIAPSDRVIYCADNELLRAAMAWALNQRCSRCSMTIDYFSDEETPGNPNEPEWVPAHIGLLGDFREEKGRSLVHKVIQKFCAARPGREFFIQTQNDVQARALEKSLRMHGGGTVQTFVGQLSQAGYIKRLKSIEILLMPYLKDRYRMRSSGVFAEAVAYGVVTVAPSGTWMAEQLAAGWGSGVVFDVLSVDSITEALIRASDDYASLKKTAAERSDAWRRAQSTTALIDHILSRLEVSAPIPSECG